MKIAAKAAGGCIGIVVAVFAPDADAQRAVATPSVVLGAPSAPSVPPAGFAAPAFVYGGEFETNLQGESTSPAGTTTKGTLYDDSNLDLYANHSTWLSFYGSLHLERNRADNADDYYTDRNSVFRSEGLTMRQLFAAVRPTDALSLYAGKIHPAFGSAWDQEPGNFYNFASDYEQDERIGVGAAYALLRGEDLSRLQISFEAFFLDTSPLSISLFSMPSFDDPSTDRPRRYTHAQFGPSNTESLGSYTVALKGGQAERGLTYQLSVTSEATDDPAGKAEMGELIGASYDPTGDGIPLGARVGVTPFLEYTHFTNFGGTAGLDRNYLVGGLTFTRARWQLVLAGGLRKSSGTSHDSDHQQNVSLNYTVTPEFSVGGGINYITVAGRSSWTFGPNLNYHIAF